MSVLVITSDGGSDTPLLSDPNSSGEPGARIQKWSGGLGQGGGLDCYVRLAECECGWSLIEAFLSPNF